MPLLDDPRRDALVAAHAFVLSGPGPGRSGKQNGQGQNCKKNISFHGESPFDSNRFRLLSPQIFLYFFQKLELIKEITSSRWAVQ
jgi:hypothetical protein